MLDQMRQAAAGGVSKVLMVLLVLSFAIWGIGGFQGYGTGTVATVGGQEVTVLDYQHTNAQLERSGRQVDPNQVLQQLLLVAALDDEAHDNNLGVSSDRVRQSIIDNPNFHGQSGAYDPNVLDAVLRDNGMDRNSYVEQVRGDLVRGQIDAAIGEGVVVPQPLIEALYRYRNEERTVSFITLDATAIEPVGTPSESDLQTYFDENAATFKAPEYRKLGLLTVDPAKIAEPDAVTEGDIQAEYDKRIANFTTPERRRVQQLRFDTKEDAEAALATGGDFDAMVTARGLTTADVDLGIKAKAEIIDPAVGEAAFAAELNAVVPVVEGAIEPSIIRVTEIEAGSVTPMAEVEPRLRHEIAVRAAAEKVADVFDDIENERDTGATLEEIAAKLGYDYRVVDVAADGTTPDGQAVTDIMGQQQLIEAAFLSDVGVVNNPVRADSALVFYDVLEITPERDRTIDEVRDTIVTAWQTAETQKRVSELADSLLKRLQAGTTLASIAAEIGRNVQTIEGVKRTETPAGLSANAAAQSFAGPEGHVANAEGDAPPARVLLHVDKVTAPAFFAEAADAQAAKEQLSETLGNDIRRAYYADLLGVRSVDVNQTIFGQLAGTAQTQ